MTTISGSGAHASAAATDRIPASKGPFTPGTKGYHTPETVRAYIASLVLGSSGYLFNYPTTANEAAGPPYTQNYQYNSITDAGGTYSNHVFQQGWNVAPGGGPIVGTEPAFAVQWESKFRQSGAEPFGAEWHVRMLDENSVERRPISIFLPHLAADRAYGGITFQGDYYNFQNWNGDNITQYSVASGWSYQSGLRFIFNNAAPIKMRNAANDADLSLPYFNASNTLAVAGPISATGATDSGTNSFFSASITLADNKNAFSLSGANTVTGTVNAFIASINCTDTLVNLLQQNGSGHAKISARVLGAKDPFFNCNVNGVRDWSFGLDNSDSDAFVVSDNFELGSNNRIRIDTVTVGFPTLPIKVPSFAVASLPSASTAGAGSVAYANNAASAACLVFSDGTNWKRCDNAATTVS